MVNPFQFTRLPQIVFKNGSLSTLPDRVAGVGKRVALITGKSSFLESVACQRLFDDLEARKLEYHVIKVDGEPSPETVDKSVMILRDKGIEVVVAIGGGSTLDTGKAVSAMMDRKESVERYLEGVGDLEHPGTRLPFIAVPTTSGTGSEATKNAVISRTGPDGYKKSLRHENFVPDLALVDPGLTLNCPPDITSASGMDCFTQLTEAFLSVKANEYTDALSFEGLKAVRSSLVKCCSDGRDIAARSGMSFAALTSGICLANAGLGVVHGFASSVGGYIDIPHGFLCGTLMAKSNEVNVRELRKKNDRTPALNKYARLGRLFLEEEGRSDDFYIDGFVDYLYFLSAELALKGLEELTLTDKEINDICSRTDGKNNPVRLETEHLVEILISRKV